MASTRQLDDDLQAALDTMSAHQIRRVPIVYADGHLNGILSLNDVVTHAGAAPASDVVRTLSHICEHTHPVAIAGAA